MYRIKIQYFPNDEFRAVMSLQKNSSGSDLSSEPPELASAEESSSAACGISSSDKSAPLTLDSNSEPGFVDCKPGFGKLGRVTKFGLNAKRTILRCGGAIDRTFAREQVVFLTGTLPGGTRASFLAMAQWSSYIVDSLKSWISKFTKATHSFYVWEFQKRGALHIHYALVVEDENARKRILDGFKLQWYRLIKNISKKSGVDCFERANGGSWANYPALLQAVAQKCKKSCAGYFAKYCGKGSPGGADGFFAPVRWWGCSRPLLKLMRELTRERVMEFLSFNTARMRIAYLEQLTIDEAVRRYTYLHQVGTGATHVAYKFIDGIEKTWTAMSNKFPQYKAAKIESLSTTQALMDCWADCLSIYDRLLKVPQLHSDDAMKYLASQLVPLSFESMPESQKISNLVAFVSMLRSPRPQFYMTWKERQASLKMFSVVLKLSEPMTDNSCCHNLYSTSQSSTLDTDSNSVYLRTKPTSDGGSDDTIGSAAKDIIPQREPFLDQIRLF